MAFSKYRNERNYSLKVTSYKWLHDLILRQGVGLPPYLVQMRPKMLLNRIGLILVQYLASRINWDLLQSARGAGHSASTGREKADKVVFYLHDLILYPLAGWLFLFQTPSTLLQTNLPPHRCSKRALFGFDMFGLFLRFFMWLQLNSTTLGLRSLLNSDLHTNPVSSILDSTMSLQLNFKF